ncbi:MAG: hypothetical protein KJN76_03730 [Eudoraea sp.]|nr:hypothetical protein [Eudoraea sp.]
MSKIYTLLISALLMSCSNYGQLSFVTKLPKKLNENSGIVSLEENKIWVIEDNGNPDELFEVNFEGELLKEFKVTNAKNKDWEDLTKDDKGNLYIADIGNNANKRKNLVIYKVPDPTKEKGDKIAAEKIEFSYPNQKDFPPKAKDFKFDAEALFYMSGNLYLITKNRARPFKGDAQIYRLPARPGKYKAHLIGTLNLCQEAALCSVTSAAISPDGRKIVLLGYGRIWIITDFEGDNFMAGKITTINHGATTQLEAVCFKNDSTLLLSDERSHGTGRNLYSYTLK